MFGYGATSGYLEGTVYCNCESYTRGYTHNNLTYRCFEVESENGGAVVQDCDSGTWYFTEDGHIIGMCIIADPRNNKSYLLPIDDCINIIKMKLDQYFNENNQK